MARDNDVYKLLVGNPADAYIAVGKTLDDLKSGSIAIFDADTNLSVSEANAEGSKRIYFALAAGEGEEKKIIKSADIQVENIVSASVVGYSPAQAHIVDITVPQTECDKEYSLKVEFKNQKIYRNQGYTQFEQSFHVKTPYCSDCIDCPQSDSNDLVLAFVKAINKNSKGFVVASAVDATGAVVTDIQAYIDTNKAVNTDKVTTNDKKLKLRLTSVPVPKTITGDINLAYFSSRETTLIISQGIGFNGQAKIETIQGVAYELGAGYDLRQREYNQRGWSGSPYRTSEVTGLQYGSFDYKADPKANYNTFVVEHKNKATGGWLEYQNDIAVEIALPAIATGDTIMTQLLKVFAKVSKRFDDLSDDFATSNSSITDIEKPSSKAVDKDGRA
jgi:hypothetical protein